MERKALMILYDHLETMSELSDEELGCMVRALFRYQTSNVEPSFSDRAMRMMWSTLKSFDDRNQQNMQEKSKARSEAGKRGMAKRWGVTEDSKNNNVISEITNDNKNNNPEPVPEPVPEPESSSSKDDSCETTKTTDLFRDFRTSIGKLSETGKAELTGYAERLGEELVREIIRKCADTGGRSWAYVRKALREAEIQGIKTAEEYRLTHPTGAGLNQRVDRKTTSGNDFLKNTSIDQSLKRLKKKEVPYDVQGSP